MWWCDVVKLSSKKNKKESKNNFNNNKGIKEEEKKTPRFLKCNEVLGNLYLALFVD